MGIQKKEVEFTKEIDDVAVLFISVINDVRSGKPVGDILSGNIQGLINAISGMENADDELVMRKVAFQTIGYRLGEIGEALLAPKSVHVVA
jgi:hypothetical protein